MDTDQTPLYEQHNDKFDETDFINSFVTTTAITKGCAVKKTVLGRIAAVTSDNDEIFGIAMENGTANSLVKICNGGYIHRIYIKGVETTSLTEGNYLYMLSDGSFTTTQRTGASTLEITDNQNVILKIK